MEIGDLASIVGKIALIVVPAVLGVILAELISRQIVRRVRVAGGLLEERRQQLETLTRALRWVVHIIIIIAALLMVLSNFVDITPLLASVGVAGLAISLGAQSFFEDLIGGCIILIENQYGVGDVISVGGVSGVVERLTLRATYLRSVDGSLHIVPNGDVRVVSNQTKEWSRALVEVGVAYEEDLDRALEVLKGVAEAFGEDPEYKPVLLEAPQAAGPLSLGDWAVTMRVMVKTQPGKQFGVAGELRRRILLACEQADITLPYPRQEVLLPNPPSKS